MVSGVVSTALIENEIRVYLLDYGITETLTIDKVRFLPKEFVTELPLYGVSNRGIGYRYRRVS